ncbi:energy transducer TonB [Elioraea sp.]|uniref:energy transducer TonB n=1 Tax=Elioraea sp. TaxID=2185103 RepID=UPI0025B837E1|nr:energy transducer TonB [Elioraea sp.]
MRVFALASLTIHALAVLALALWGTPRPIGDADSEPPGIPVVFSAGSGGERVGEETSEPPPRTEPAQPEAPGQQPSEAVAAEAEAPPPEPQTPPPPQQRPEPSLALPLPPPPPPPPPEPRQPREMAEPPSPPSAQGAARAEAASEAEEAGSVPREGSAAFLLSSRDATVGRRVDPVVPVEARQARMQGTVVLTVTISPEGVPMAVDVYRSSGHMLLDRAAQEALWQWRFDPARRGGVPIEDRIAVPFVFRIVN